MMNCTQVFYNLSLIILVIFIGHRLTNEASATSSVLIKSMAVNDKIYHQKVDSLHLLAQIRGRKVAVQNFLFKIDWKVFIAVSLVL